MPSPDQILNSLSNLANSYQLISILWHFYFSVFCIALLSGARPTKRQCGIILSFPILSVGITAWMIFNPFNGIVFSIMGLLLLYFSFKMPDEPVSISPLRSFIPGLLMIVFGWIYPHFIKSDSVLMYLYKAPTGIIPCATLSIVIGFTLLLNFNRKSFGLSLSIMGLFYGFTGIFQLHVYIDAVLLLGAILLLIFTLVKSVPAALEASAAKEMTVFGVGPKLGAIILPYLILVIIVHSLEPSMRMTDKPYMFFGAAGIFLILIGLVFWISSGKAVIKAFNENKLMTSGVFAVVRNPMYSAFIIFFTIGAGIWLRSWAFLTLPFAASIAFFNLIKKEEDYLERTFGKQFLDYKARVNSLIPLLRFRK